MNEVVLNLERALKLQQPEEEAKLHQDALQRATVFRPMDPRNETRENFAIPLYHALEHAGFRSFLDAQYGTEVYGAIHNSMCVIVLFSKNYVSSPGCLDEIVQFVERAKHINYSLLPIYYEVDPDDVKYLRGIHGSALEAHRKGHGFKVDIWRRALKEFAEYQPIVMSGDPEKLLDRIVDMVRNEFCCFPTKFWKY